MRPGEAYPAISNRTQGASKEPSKSEQTTPERGIDNLHARLRKLERRIAIMESKLSVTQRDTWRIEKKLLANQPPVQQPQEAEKFPAALFL